MAIQYDVWQTGMSRQEMVTTAEKQNLPVAKDGTRHISKTFNQAMIEGEATRFYYVTTLYQSPATVYLSFTPSIFGEAQKLYDIEVVFTDKARYIELHPYLALLMMEPYGKGQNYENYWEHQLVWHPGVNAEVRLVRNPDQVKLKYTDFEIRALGADNFSFESSGGSCGDSTGKSRTLGAVACSLDMRTLH
jgi:hypothetical protein